MTTDSELARIKSELNLWQLERLNMLAKRPLLVGKDTLGSMAQTARDRSDIDRIESILNPKGNHDYR